jgi:23S rRNA (pseudouridine1915-N3)-methyltransferase
LKIRILWPGKTRKPYFHAAIEDYVSRIRKFVPIEIVEVREAVLRDTHRGKRVRVESKEISAKRQAPLTVLLDPNGKILTSEEFACWLEKASRDVDFILGGPAGVEIDSVSLRLSFGRMTLPHELARVFLVEQIYRALTIQHHLPYHK